MYMIPCFETGLPYVGAKRVAGGRFSVDNNNGVRCLVSVWACLGVFEICHLSRLDDLATSAWFGHSKGWGNVLLMFECTVQCRIKHSFCGVYALL